MTRASRIVAGILIFGGIVLLISWWVVRRALPGLDGSVSVPGLESNCTRTLLTFSDVR
jgi:hypothetical protein